MAKKILPVGNLKNIMPTAAIHIGDDHLVRSCGNCDVNVCVRTRSLVHRFYVMDTETLDFVLGTAFFDKQPWIPSVTLQAPYVLHLVHRDGREPDHWKSHR